MTESFGAYDARGYPTLDVRAGYAAWAPTYDAAVDDRLDLDLLARVATVPWSAAVPAADLGCGTGRMGVWLRQRGVAELDGVDLSPAMLAQAAAKGHYARLAEADLAATGLPGGCYGLVLTALAACHVSDLGGLYAEAGRLLRPEGWLAVVDFHPFFLLRGIPTHFDGPDGRPTAIENVVHLISDHVAAGRRAGMALAEMHERLIDDDWIGSVPTMAKHRRQPVSFAMVWQAPG